MLHTPLARELGIEHPIFAFTYQPEVAAAVSRNGGLGVLGAVRFSPGELAEALDYMDRETGGRPYGVDVVMPASSEEVDADQVPEILAQLERMIPQEHRDFIERVLDEHKVGPLPEGEQVPRGLLGWTDATARPQVEIALSHNIALLANALGPPPRDIVDQAHDCDVPVAALVGRVDQALKQRDQGVDIVVAQGTEAGGHSGEIATMVLVPEVVEALAPSPVLAAGGIGRGTQVAAALALGAQGVWTGSVWLTTAEHELQEALRSKLLAASSRDTVRSRSLTGKPARQLRTAWTDAWEDPANPDPLGMPLQYLLTSEAQHRIRVSGKEELLGIPVGQIIGSVTATRPVAEVMQSLVHDAVTTIKSLQTLTTSEVAS
jgi:NAD(P)H-dependent flavin oxidoreductase YrpB (nitropropane dioxygenase family)